MDKFFILMSLGAFLFAALPVLANEGGHGSIDEVLEEIFIEQGVSLVEDIDCDALTERQFEELGDAVMSIMVGEGEQHEQI